MRVKPCDPQARFGADKKPAATRAALTIRLPIRWLSYKHGIIAFPPARGKKKIDSGARRLYLKASPVERLSFCKVLFVKKLRQVSVIGLGLVGGSITLAVRQHIPGITVVGYSHRAVTRRKAKALGAGVQIVDDLAGAAAAADLVILATPIFTFEGYFRELAGVIRPDCIVTDVGSTKLLPHAWAESTLGRRGRYVGSHPVAGSEQRGVEFARDDLFDQARCILTTTPVTDRAAVRELRGFWSALGCSVQTMSPAEHDRVFANISHLPHVMAAGLVNASDDADMRFAGKGFLDSTRIASGPATVWTDVLLANRANIAAGIDRAIVQLARLQTAIKKGNRARIAQLLESARRKRAGLVKYKIRKKELLR
jgi:prephenate dehydrogenase